MSTMPSGSASMVRFRGSLLGAQDPPFGAPFCRPDAACDHGLNYTLGQRVEVWPFHAGFRAHGGAMVTLPGLRRTPRGSFTTSRSPGTTTPPRRSRSVTPSGCGVRLITAPDGAIATDSNWGLNHDP